MMSRPTPFDFTQPSDFRISKVVSHMIVGLDKDGVIHRDIANPDYEAWFMFKLRMAPHAASPWRPGIIIVTDGDYWFKVAYALATSAWLGWPEPVDDSYLCQLKLQGVDFYAQSEVWRRGIMLHRDDKATINETIKDLVQKEEYSLHA